MNPTSSLQPPVAFLQKNRECIDVLMEKHPGRTEAEVAKALWDAQGNSEVVDRLQIAAAASQVLDEEVQQPVERPGQ